MVGMYSWHAAACLLSLTLGVGVTQAAAEEPSAAERVRNGFADVEVVESPPKEVKYETIEVLPVVKAPTAAASGQAQPPERERREAVPEPRRESAEEPRRSSRKRTARVRKPRERDDDATGAIPASRASPRVSLTEVPPVGGGARGQAPSASPAPPTVTSTSARMPAALAPTAPTAPAPASPAAASAAPPAGAPGAAWSVQLVDAGSEKEAEAAFSRMKRNNRRLLARQKAYIQKASVNGAELNRVRVDVDNRESADTLCASLTSAGQTCTVVPR